MPREQLNLTSNFALGFFIFFKKFLFLFLFLGSVSFSYQAESKSKTSNKEKEAPTKIRSDIIDIKRKSQTVDFFGHVIVEKEDSSLLADKMTVFYEEKKAGKANSAKTDVSSIKRIDAKENVKIFSEEFIATGDSGYYNPKENIFVLEKNVIVNNGISIASGNKFIYHIETKKGNFVGRKNEAVIGGDKRVTVVIGDDIQDQKDSKKSK
jgi:lipopolysaccharide transport protein LptA